MKRDFVRRWVGMKGGSLERRRGDGFGPDPSEPRLGEACDGCGHARSENQPVAPHIELGRDPLRQAEPRKGAPDCRFAGQGGPASSRRGVPTAARMGLERGLIASTSWRLAARNLLCTWRHGRALVVRAVHETPERARGGSSFFVRTSEAALHSPTSARTLNAREKALAVNLDPRRYGTFAEIGAGQEVVRWFFRAGAAAGTIAKSISAYDMTVSDAIYGSCERYVCRERLDSMLDYEFELTFDRLSERRGNQTAFFAFADTVVARSFKGNHECHGWMGVTFQSHPRDQASRIVIHVRMLDSETTLQQEALGIVGVNLLYGAFFLFSDPDALVESLIDGLSTDRVEIDMIEFSGIEFRHVDNRVMSLRLVQLGLSEAAMFGADGSGTAAVRGAS